MRPLADLLEMQFDLMWHLHMSLSDIEGTDTKELEWLHGRVVEQIKKENKVRREAMTGKKEIDG